MVDFGPDKADQEPQWADFGLERANLQPDLEPDGPEMTDLGSERGRGGETDRRMSGNAPLCPTGHWPFGAAAQ